MRYLTPLLTENETVLYDGKIHPIVFLKGALFLSAALFCLTVLADLPAKGGVLMWTGYYLREFIGLDFLYDGFWQLHHWIRDHQQFTSFLGWALFALSLNALVRAAIEYFFIEVAVTNLRILVKRGVYNVTTAEIDVDRIAGVTVFQPFTGKILNYGWVLIHGFMQNVSGLPPLVDPYKLQQQLGNSSHFQRNNL